MGCGGMTFERVGLVFVGCFFVGLGQGLGQFYRFSAVEIAPQDMKNEAITYVLSGGIIAAFLGPTTANYSVDMITSREFLGSYMMMGLIGIVNQFTVLLVTFPDTTGIKEKLLKLDSANSSGNGESEAALLQANVGNNNSSNSNSVRVVQSDNRPLREIISQPLFIVSCAVATLVSYMLYSIAIRCTSILYLYVCLHRPTHRW